MGTLSAKRLTSGFLADKRESPVKKQKCLGGMHKPFRRGIHVYEAESTTVFHGSSGEENSRLLARVLLSSRVRD
jgi:hypothetical protein